MSPNIAFMSEVGRKPGSKALLKSNLELLIPNFQYGGDEEIRTPDPLLARQVLSQLSYTPTRISFEILQN
jgi:hypothetical protein